MNKLVNNLVNIPPYNIHPILTRLWSEFHMASQLTPQVSPGTAKHNSLYYMIPKQVQTWINNNPMHLQVFDLQVHHRTYHLHFYTQSESDDINTYIHKINTWLSVASKYAESRCSKQVNVHLYLTPLKKQLPKSKQQDIDEEHANTAFTSSCAPNTEIILFREEEWFKVFIHESFHNMGLDFSEHYNQTKGQQMLSSMFYIQSKFKLYEVYCEMWAELINVLINTPLNQVAPAIQMERKFSVFQAAKILDFYGLNYEDLYDDSASTYKENTEVFCYYVLKSILMYNCNTFLDWIIKEQNGSLQFHAKKVEKFIKDLIVPFYKQDEYIATINHTQTYFDVPRNTYIGTTMRMSYLH